MALQIFGINNPNVSEMFTVMIAKYKDALAQRPEPWAMQMSGFTSSGSLRIKYPIDLTVLDGFREWLGSRDVKDGDVEAFFIDSKPWERSVQVPLDDVLSGQFTGYVNKVPNLIRAAAVHPNRLIANLLLNGKTTTVSWDKLALFHASHPVNTRDASKSTFATLYTAKPFSRANFQFAKKAFRQLRAPDGKTSLGMKLTHVMGGTDMEEVFDNLFRKQLLATDAGTAQETNIYYGGAQPIIAPELDANNEPGVWYGLALNTDARPFEIQMRDGGSPDIKILGDGTEHAILTNKVGFFASMFGNAGPAIHHTIIRFEP